ncbi:MAG: hypothetical protein ACKOI2_11245 [Actinomycetota bacterium]
MALWMIADNATGLTFFFDDWDFLLHREISIDGLLLPHNGHLSTLPVIVYVFLREIFGTDSYVPFQVVGITVHTVTCVIAAGMVYRRAPFLAVTLLPVLLLLGSGWQNILWPFQTGMIGALLFGLLAIDEASRDHPRNRSIVWVSLSLLCAGGGVAVAGVVTLSFVMRRQWQLVKLMLPVLFLYGLWFSVYGESQSQPGNLSRTPRYVLDSAVWSSAGIGSWSFRTGRFVLCSVLLIVGLSVAFRRRNEATRASLLLLSMLIVTWLLTGISRSHLAEPQASRYVYVGAIVLVCCTGLALTNSRFKLVLPAVLCLLPILLPSSMSQMKKGASGLRDTSFHVRSALAALDMTDVRPGSDSAVDARAPQISVSAYDRLAASDGRIGFSIPELRALPDPYRNTTDNMLNRLGVSQISRSTGLLCGAQSRSLSGVQVLTSGETLVILPSTETEIRLARFSDVVDGIAATTLNGGAWYSITNRAENDVPALRFELPLTGVVGCVLSDGGAD